MRESASRLRESVHAKTGEDKMVTSTSTATTGHVPETKDRRRDDDMVLNAHGASVPAATSSGIDASSPTADTDCGAVRASGVHPHGNGAGGGGDDDDGSDATHESEDTKRERRRNEEDAMRKEVRGLFFMVQIPPPAPLQPRVV